MFGGMQLSLPSPSPFLLGLSFQVFWFFSCGGARISWFFPIVRQLFLTASSSLCTLFPFCHAPAPFFRRFGINHNHKLNQDSPPGWVALIYQVMPEFSPICTSFQMFLHHSFFSCGIHRRFSPLKCHFSLSPLFCLGSLFCFFASDKLAFLSSHFTRKRMVICLRVYPYLPLE